MCEQSVEPVKLLKIKSVAEALGNKCCFVNNGKPHAHVLKAENQRRERVHVKGHVTTRSAKKQLIFLSAGNTGDDWTVDFIAYGQRISSQQADIIIGAVHSRNEDIEAELQYEYDDPFSQGYTSFSLTIPVNL
jgi:hypothetical protein